MDKEGETQRELRWKRPQGVPGGVEADFAQQPGREVTNSLWERIIHHVVYSSLHYAEFPCIFRGYLLLLFCRKPNEPHWDCGDPLGCVSASTMDRALRPQDICWSPSSFPQTHKLRFRETLRMHRKPTLRKLRGCKCAAWTVVPAAVGSLGLSGLRGSKHLKTLALRRGCSPGHTP